MFKPIAVVAAVATMSAPAFADAPLSFAFAFSYDQAQLSSQDGAARVHQQLLIEASNACRKVPPSAQRGVDSACREQLVAGAVKKIDNPMLTAAHSGRARAGS